MTYKETKERFAELRRALNLYDALHIFGGVPYNKVHNFIAPYYASGYTMGETLVVRCNGITIAEADYRQHYAKSCKWRPKHGEVVLNFTKKAMRQYVELCAALEAETDVAERYEIIKKKDALIRAAIDWQKSVINLKAKGGAK